MFLEHPITVSPFLTSWVAMAAPMPDEAPVTTATFPFQRSMLTPPLSSLGKGGAPNFGRFLIPDKLAFMLDFSETH